MLTGYALDDLVSRIWAICVDTHFHYDSLPNDEDCGIDAAILAKEACGRIKKLIEDTLDTATNKETNA